MIYLVFEDFDDGWCYDESHSYEDKLLAVFSNRQQAIEYMVECGKSLVKDGYKSKPIQANTTSIKNCVTATKYEHHGKSYFHDAVESDFGEIKLY